MVGITTVSPQAVDESAPCLHVRSASATSQRGCRRCSAQGFFEAARTIQLAGTRIRYTPLFGLQQDSEVAGKNVRIHTMFGPPVFSARTPTL